MRQIDNPYRGRGFGAGFDDVPWPSDDPTRVLEMLGRCPRHGPTPLVEVPDLAAACGAAEMWVKDERGRMGLGSFKALGAAYVIACHAAEGTASGRVYVAASAGNHGMSVAAGAAAFGARAVIYLAETVPEDFAQRLRDLGAEVVRAGAIYEDSMAAAQKRAEDEAWTLLSDSSWHGYMELPHRLMEGYLALISEAMTAMPAPPSHVFLQAGVGGLAVACAALIRARWGDGPRVVVVEPEAAPALMASIEVGRAVLAPGPVSCMGRLDCKEPSLIALKGLARDADAFMTISEDDGLAAARLCAGADLPTTPSGSAGLAGAIAADLPEDARVLVILSEGPEDA